MIRQRLLDFATVVARVFPALRRVPEPLKHSLRKLYPPGTKLPIPQDDQKEVADYDSRLAREREIFVNQIEVNDLPPIFHYWSNKYLRPKLEQFGFSNPDEFFALYLEKTIGEESERPVRFASVGAGNCDTEVRVARILIDRGISDFTIECLDMNETMLSRGQQLAIESGVSDQIRMLKLDFNNWSPQPGSYSGIMANQSLHHVLELESLFDAIDCALTDEGRFLTADMIGRNGHMRWPEALQIIHEYWRELPQTYRWNAQLKRHEELLENWDCSKEGFEGIRAQDILPLLIERFSFELFLPFGNLIDPFIDRSFGPHFDPDSQSDRELIDRIQERDHAELMSGSVKPTHLFAVMRKQHYTGECRHSPGLTPNNCVRYPD